MPKQEGAHCANESMGAIVCVTIVSTNATAIVALAYRSVASVDSASVVGRQDDDVVA